MYHWTRKSALNFGRNPDRMRTPDSGPWADPSPSAEVCTLRVLLCLNNGSQEGYVWGGIAYVRSTSAASVCWWELLASRDEKRRRLFDGHSQLLQPTYDFPRRQRKLLWMNYRWVASVDRTWPRADHSRTALWPFLLIYAVRRSI